MTTVHLPEFCAWCKAAVVHGLDFPEEGPWRAALIIAQINLFQVASGDDRVWQRCSKIDDDNRDPNDLSLVIAEIGCLGCFKPNEFGLFVRLARKHGIAYMAEISRGVRADPEWPLDFTEAAK